MAGRSLRIGELAAQVSLHSSALRYYEQIGLIPPPERTGGQRAYPPSTVRRIALIRMAQQVGLPLAEMRALFTGATPGTSATRHWRALAERKLPEIDAATVAQEDPAAGHGRDALGVVQGSLRWSRRVSTVQVGQPQPRKSWSPVKMAASSARASATGGQSRGSRGTRRRAVASWSA